MGRIVASDLYPAIRKFLPENELAKTLKAFSNETAEEEGGGKKKKARILKDLELVEACQLWYDTLGKTTVSAANLYPALRRFLQETGLLRTLKAFGKEVAEDENGGAKPKKAKLLAELELTEACQLWYEARVGGEAPAEEGGADAKENAAENGNACVGDVCVRGAGKRKREAAEEAAPEEEAEAAAPAAEAAAEAEEEKPSKKRKKEKEAKERKPGVPFKRIDEEKWTSVIKDDRLKDNTHAAKMKYGGSAGDSWGDKASEDLLKVKGKGFRKEMAKKKRASWRGGGEIDQGVNSIKFSDSEDE